MHPIGQLTHTRRSDGAPETDGALKTVVRVKILHYRQLYLNRPDPIAFLPVTVDTSGRIYDDFSRLLFLHPHREGSALTNELRTTEESDQFRFLRAVSLTNLKGVDFGENFGHEDFYNPRFVISVFIPLPCFIRSRCPTPLLTSVLSR